MSISLPMADDPVRAGIPALPAEDLKALTEEIRALAKEKGAVILAHNYQLPEVQDVADVVGDSLGLSIEAAKTDAELIVFCGVHFMAESASVLSPDKTVLIPDVDAGCSLADSITPEQLKELRTMVEQMERLVKDGHNTSASDPYHLLNLAFHDRIVEFVGNRKLIDLYRRLVKELSLFRRVNLADGRQIPVSVQEHRAILKAIASGQCAIALSNTYYFARGIATNQEGLTEADGAVVKEGKRDLRDMAFMMKLTMGFRDDPLRHEKALLDDWLSAEFHRAKKN